MSIGRRNFLILVCLLTWAGLRVAPSVRAEGSKEMNNNTGDRTYLEYRSDFTAGSSVPRKTIVYAYVNSGEKISLGSSACGVGSGTIGAGLGAIIWYTPDGKIGTNTSTTIGVITNITQEFAGPLPNPGGYTPTNLTVGAGQTGVWRIDFVSPQNGVDIGPGTANPANSANWTQPNNVQYVSAWDVTVRSSGGTAIPGRVYTTQIAMNMGGAGRLLRSTVYFLTKDGYQYLCDLNGIDPYGFNFFADNNGFEAGGVGTGASYKSVALAVNDVQNPNAADTATEITHKLFFNTPAADLPASANSFAGTEWLLVSPVPPPTISSTLFIGVDGTTNQVGSGLGGTFSFTASGSGVYIIALDLNGNGSYTDAVDRVLEGPATLGVNNVAWDGKDGNGNPAPRSGGVGFLASASLADGVVHFPFLDVENAPTGFKITRQNGAGSPSSTIFYNDTGLGGSKYLPPTGISSAAGAHGWTGNFGNNNGIDTWTFVIGNANSNSLIIKVADLQVVSKSISPTVVAPTSNVTYTVVIKNNGPDTVQFGHFIEKFPPGLTNLVLNSSVFTLAGSIVSSSWSSNTYDATVSMVSNSVGTFTFTGSAAPGLGSIFTNVALFLSYNDVGDPNDPTRVGAGNNNQTNITAVTFSVNGTVYNDANFNGILDGGETGTNLNLYAKLIPTNAPGTAVQAVLVDNSGNYSLTTSNAGGYIVILDNNNTLSDVTPFLPAGWLGTQAPGQTINGISLTASNAIGQNFGLYHGSYLVVGKSATPTIVAGLSNTLFSITITNTSSISNALATIVDNLPTNIATGAGLTYSNGTSLFNGSPIANPTIVSVTNLTWTGPFSIPGNSVATLSFRAKIPATAGAYTNKAYALIGTTQIDATTNSTDNVPAQAILLEGNYADLGVLKTGPATIPATNQFAYSITVSNGGPSAATSLVVTDSLPANLTFISATGGGTTNASLTNVFWSVASLASGLSTNLGITVKAPSTGVITNLVVAGSTANDPNLSDNTTNWITAVTDQADLRAIKTGPATVNATNQFAYTIVVTNNGPSTAVSVVVTDSLPASLTFISATGGGATNASLTNVFWSVASLTNGAITNLTLTVKAPATGLITNSLLAGSITADPTPGNNSTNWITAVTDQADLRAIKTGPATVNATNQFAYTIVVTNNGPSTAVSVVVTDSLPASLTFISATGGGATNASLTNVFWSVASLTNGAITNLTLTVKAPATGLITNSLLAGSITADPTPGNNSTNWITAVTDQADLRAIKTGPATVNATNQFAYTIVVTNNGPSTAVSVVVTDSLPASLTFISATGGGATNASLTNVFWSVTSLTNGAITNLTLTVKAPATGLITNSLLAGSITADPTPGNNSTNWITAVTDQADLAVAKTGAVTIPATNQFTYTIAVTNNGPSTAVSVVVTDSLPANLTFISATGGGSTNASLTNVFWSVASLTNGAVTNLSLTVKAPASGIISNFVVTGSTIGDPTPGNNNAGPFITTVTGQADLAVTKTGAVTIPATNQFTYTIAVTNNGPSTAVSVVVTDSLPANLTFISATGGGATNASLTNVFWSVASLTNGAVTNLSLTVKAPASGIISNFVLTGSTTGDPTPGNNSAGPFITTVTDQADLAVAKTGAVTIPATNQFTYTIAVTNNGPSTAVSVVVTDSLPANLTFISATGGGATNASLTNVFWSVASLTNGAVTNLSLTVKAPASGIISNYVLTGSTTGDPTPGNNNAGPFITTVTGQADLAVAKNGAVTIPATNQFTYTIAVTNNGPSTAVSVVVTDSLPANLTFISATGGGATNASLTNVFWSVASLTNGAVTNLSLTVKAPASGIISNYVLTGSTTGDPTPGNNSAGPFITTVTDQADLAVAKSGVATIPATNQFTYTIAVTNNGPSTAVSVVVTDSLPANLTFISATGGGATNASLTNVFWSVASLTNGAVTNLSLTVKAPASGIISNFVLTGSTTGDPTPGNNNAGPVITTVTDLADLAVAKSGVATIPATNQFTYTIAVTNNGPSTAVSVVVTDSLPANLTFISATGGGATNASLTNVFWSVASLTNGAVTNLSLTVKAPASGIISNYVLTGSTTGDPTPGNNTAGPFITTVTSIADLAITKSGATSWPAVSNLVYTITLTNLGPSAATSVVVTDTLPATVTYVGASAGGTHSGNFVTWGAIPAFAAGAASNFTVTVTTPAAGVLTNTAAGGSVTLDPTPANNDGTAAGAKVITTLIGGVTVSGFVYNDLNRNATKDNSETGSGLTLYAKLFNGTLTNVVSVNSGSGSYAFSNTVSGTYTIVVSTNNSLTDVTGSLPVGWVGTEITNQTRANVAVATADIPSQNFGLYNGTRLSGMVFADTGNGAGTPNDGLRNGNESGIPGVTVKLTDNTGGTVYDTTTTDGGGTYTLYVPAGATTVKVVETNLTGFVSTGATVGNTAGTYDRPSDTISFANVAGTTYGGVNFGDVPVNQFMPDNQQTALPGSTIVYAHTFIAGSGGQVTFTVTNIPSPNIAGWTSTLYVDSNCNGKLDANEALLTNTVTVLAGQQLCLLMKEFVPAGAALNAQDLAVITATFSYTNATPVLQATVVHNDLTTVGNPTTAGLTLVKAVDKATALPGEILTYTLIYQNTGSGNLTNVVIADATPAYSTFVGATTGPLPPNLTGVTLTVPASNSVGGIRWQFIGVLTPAGSGTNAFSVQIVQ